MYQYDSVFYNYINKGALDSAGAVLPIVKRYFPVTSVVDFGCGQGAWLSAWKQLGVGEVLGVDGQYVGRDALLVGADEFEPRDLTQPIRLGRKFDLVQSLEVAEHLPEDAADGFVDTLASHGDVILFSAAAPGQGGENHINERPYEYWRDKFCRRGYALVDLIRPLVRDNPAVEPWYRYNSFLYVRQTLLEALPAEVAASRVDDLAPVPDVSPLLYKIRKAFLRLLTPAMYTWLAIAKKRYIVAARRGQ